MRPTPTLEMAPCLSVQGEGPESGRGLGLGQLVWWGEGGLGSLLRELGLVLQRTAGSQRWF